MQSVSSLLRLVCGLGVLGLAWTSWSQHKDAIAAGGPVQLFGQTLPADSASVTLAFGLIAVLALGLILLGVLGLLRGKR